MTPVEPRELPGEVLGDGQTLHDSVAVTCLKNWELPSQCLLNLCLAPTILLAVGGALSDIDFGKGSAGQSRS